ncbi:RTA1 like protein-domain-containing protein [Durotheca rogersii]|uniref:RTA1 like protein-domain-containing protein n=1 Tax=Durotheca rogersii TaxID=419775 RepID=UPI00221E75BF|nr:RTA1 like protein-domain-containing protein [Durotheca rogersii]KAI5866961.1 RTA1 like protein-domain-containing protein [Durotheca rogersii]
MKSIASCDWDTCPVAASPYGYPPSSAASALFLIIHIGALIACLSYTLQTRRWLRFSTSVSIACLFEIAGYGVRLASVSDPWNVFLYATSTSFIIVAPAFVSVGVYLTVPETIAILGVEHSPIDTKHYPRLIWIDAVGFIIQAGGIVVSFSDISAHTGLGPRALIGNPIIAGGLALQALSLISFIALFGIVLFRAAVAQAKFGHTTFHSVHGFVPMAHRFKFFVTMLLISVMCLFARAIYQTLILASGLKSWNAKNQALFAGFDGFLVAEAAIGLMIAHPVIFLRNGIEKKLGSGSDPDLAKERTSPYRIEGYCSPSADEQSTGPRQTPPSSV